MGPDGDWPEVRLGDLVEIKHGWPFKSQFFSEELTGRPIVVNIGNFRYTGGFRFDSTTIREYRHEYPKEYELDPGDILLAMTCQTAGGEILGIPARVPNDERVYLHNQRLGKVVITDPSRVVAEYLYWVFNWSAFNRYLFGTASGTKILHTSPGRIESFRFRLPPSDVQRAIASTLGSLDNKIELNRRMNATLEAMARALFQAWFVDFEPTANSVSGQTRTGKTPKGWSVARLGDHVTATKGLSYKGDFLTSSTSAALPLHNLNSVYEGGGYKYEGIKWYSGEYRERHEVRPGDVIVANTEQGHDCLLLGYAAIVPETYGQEGLFSHHLYRLRIRDGSPLTSDFLCQLLNSGQIQELVSGYGNGTTVNMLPIDALQHPQFPLPPRELIMQYSELARSYRVYGEKLRQQTITLSQMRDMLLPKLMSGEVRVRP